MGIADVEAVLQNRCSIRDYSTTPEAARVALHAIRRLGTGSFALELQSPACRVLIECQWFGLKST